MDPRTHEGLSRTSRLINEQFFGGRGDEQRISAALPQLAIAITADSRNAQTIAAQTLVVALATLIARMGIDVQLDCPDPALASPQPPLTGGRLRSSLVELGADLIPGVPIAAELRRPPVMSFAIGDSPCAPPGALRLSGGDWDLAIESAAAPGRPWEAALPFGALACAAAAAAEGLRAALPKLAELVGTELVAASHRLETGQAVRLDLRRWFPGEIATDIGPVDVISGGAITSATLYVLLRAPELEGAIRVIEGEGLDLSNVNRYMLSRASLDGVMKTRMLASCSRPQLRITGVPHRYDADRASAIGPLAPRVLVGVDHIPSRWLVQERATGWVGVGATQSLDTLVSAHRPGEPCAGCLHQREPDADELVPTISFVSFWSGLLLALELLTEAAGAKPDQQALFCWPFGYDGPHLMRLPVAAQPACPVGCAASRARAA
ncbi:MAG: hypothetical protein H0U12_12720 [Thermoleophilaceae bacterium]|nr:hypothetical protein [Thermoleophilaceae bacterium]